MLEYILRRVLDSCSEEMRAAILSGCEIESSYEDGVLVVKTRYPIATVHDKLGNIVRVLERR